MPMLRKLIMLAAASALAKKAYDGYRHSRNTRQNPFPTAKDHPRASAGRTRSTPG